MFFSLEIICFCIAFCLGKKIKSAWRILKTLKLCEFGKFHLYTCNENSLMDPFVGLSSLEPLPVLRPLLWITAPQIVAHTLCLQRCSLLSKRDPWESRGTAVPINWVKALLADWLMSSALSLYAGFFPGGKFSFISIASKSKTNRKIIIIEPSSDFAMNEHSCRNQLALVITTRAKARLKHRIK